MHTYVPVQPGPNMTDLLRKDGCRLTKRWVREVMRDHPEWDWRNLGPGGTYVNGGDAIHLGLTLQVYGADGATTVAMVAFQTDDTMPYGYLAVVS